MQLISATCKFPGGQPRTSASGREYVSALFVGPDGQEHRVYAPASGITTEALQQLAQGQTVTLALDSRGKAHLALPDQQQPMGFTAPPAAAPQPVPTVQHQQSPAYAAQPQAQQQAPASNDPVLAAAAAWARAYHALIAAGVPADAAPAAASTSVIQGMSRR